VKDQIQQAAKFIGHRLGARTKHGIHSPFVFDLITKVFEDKKIYPCYDKTESLRKNLLKDETIIDVLDLGAGSKKNIPKAFRTSERKIKDICKNAEKNKKYGQLLYRIVNYFKPELIFDLGTSLGITTLYLSEGNSNAKVITIEGCPETAAFAEKNFNKYGSKNIHQTIGNFDEVLAPLLTQNCLLPAAYRLLFFFDGNHQKQATLNYFYQCLEYAGNDSVFIFDDIHWSAGMEEAWTIIKKDPRVTVTIDIFQMGFVFFRKEQAKEDFIVKF
jgi:predicted O-methyltransferase YrrM